VGKRKSLWQGREVCENSVRQKERKNVARRAGRCVRNFVRQRESAKGFDGADGVKNSAWQENLEILSIL
jgi:hypothetical protein